MEVDTLGVEESDFDHSSISPVHNPTGRNQYDCLLRNDERVARILREYQRRAITSRIKISQLLLVEHNIKMSPTTVARRRKDLGLQAGGATTQSLSSIAKRQLVLDQLSQDPLNRRGPRTIRECIVSSTGILLTRKYIETEMRVHEPEGFALREPTAKKIPRVAALVSLGPHHEWSGDGHDKLSGIGFPIWAVRDVFSGKWLGMWVVPNNRCGATIAYLYLSLVYKLGGMPLQTTTDCGSETTQVYGFANALREHFVPNLPTDELPAHRFLKSVHNITIERGWLPLRQQWGDNVKFFWEAGRDLYNDMDLRQCSLVHWLWPKLIQQELDQLRDRFNNHVVRRDKKKKLPSGVSPNVAFALHDQYGGENCLQSVDRNVIWQLMEDIGGESHIQFVNVEYATHAEAIFNSLNLTSLTLQNVWATFSTMLPLM